MTDLKVLLVEDNKSALALMKMVLKGIRINQIYTAQDGRAALDFLEEAPELVDFIVCDWQMPRMSGLELLQEVRTVYPDMPFMMVTGKADMDSVNAAKEFAVDAYLTKPY
ncbi:MAG: response regulator [Alphaproteobacteria bacterium]|nr:response regulator [Alphaproteobacteria bacterium]MDP6587856.1 response regulator [Alphaproteobacteria bacterium]MDP6816618.1 response regulator [Alphaproteobacteria bacterium]